jgi:hypothetical protein
MHSNSHADAVHNMATHVLHSTWNDCGFVNANLSYKSVWVTLQLLHQHLLPLLCRNHRQAGVTHRQVPYSLFLCGGCWLGCCCRWRVPVCMTACGLPLPPLL